MSDIILVAETGSDIPRELAKQKNIQLVPMHVSMGEQSFDDGTFPPADICAYYKKTGILPTTSCSSPDDFVKIFDAIHKQWPEKKILYLAYSAATTSSYQSGILAAEGRDYIASLDTRHVSAGQGAIVIRMAQLLEQQPAISLQEAVLAAQQLIKRARMCFLPDNLEYLRAGGRVSNVSYLGSRILGIHPCIEVLDGLLIATRKYRGKMEKLVPKILHSYTEDNDLELDQLWLLRSVGLAKSICRLAEQTALELKFKSVAWIDTGCVITTHGGPGAFGIAGFAKS